MLSSKSRCKAKNSRKRLFFFLFYDPALVLKFHLNLNQCGKLWYSLTINFIIQQHVLQHMCSLSWLRSLHSLTYGKTLFLFHLTSSLSSYFLFMEICRKPPVAKVLTYSIRLTHFHTPGKTRTPVVCSTNLTFSTSFI